MSKKSRVFLNLFLVIINLIVIIKLVKDSFRIKNFDYFFVIILIVTGVLLYLFISEVLKGKKRKLICIIITIVLLAISVYKYSEFFIREWKYLYDSILVINARVLEGKEIEFAIFKHIFAIVIPFLIALSGGVTNKFSKFPVALSSGVYIGFWYQIFYEKVILNLIYFIGVFVVTIAISEYMKRCKEYEGLEFKIDINKKVIVVAILVVSLAVPIIVKVMPQEFNGKSIDGIFEVLKNQFVEKKKTEEDYISDAIRYRYTMRNSGYSDSSYTLGGPIKINSRQVFTVKSDKPYYLRGRIKDNYSGHSWQQSKENIEEYVENKYKYHGRITYLIDALKDYEGYGDLRGIEKELIVTPGRNFKSGSCFTPNGAYSIGEVEEKIFYNDIPIFMADDYIMEPYTVKFVSYGDYDDYLNDISKEHHMKLIYDENYTLPKRTYGQSDLDYYSYLESKLDTTNADELKKYNKFKWTYMNYLQVPDTVGEQVYILVDNILVELAKKEGCAVELLSNQQKALAIRNFLKENYKYETNMKKVDGNKDFVTEFLINEQEGYCTYFTSANTIMCRIAGIPARYVEGFNMVDNKNSKEEYVVTNEEAHAWTEILVNPYRDIWAVTDGTAARDSIELEEMVEKPEEDKPLIENEEIGNSNNNIEKIEKKKWDLTVVIRSAIPIMGLLLFAGTIILMLITVFNVKRNRIIRNSSLIPIYIYIVKRLKTIGIEKKGSEGNLEFAESINDNELKGRLIDLTKGLYDEYYGEITCENIDKEEFLDYIENYIKERSKRHKYLVNKYCSFKGVN